MKKLAYCLECVFFRHWGELSQVEKEKVVDWVDRYRPGQEPKGFCQYYNRPVTYLIGSCRGFTPRRMRKPEPKSLLEYLER